MKKLIICLPLALLFIACDERNNAIVQEKGMFTDSRDGQSYRTIKIGDYTWMAENLNIKTKGSWCYDNADTNCVKYGRLYTWYAAMKVCPDGWHLPSNAEWDSLMVALGGIKSKRMVQKVGYVDFYRSAGKKLKSKSGWNGFDGKSNNGTDNYGFSAMPGGVYHNYDEEVFGNVGNYGYWWSATEYSDSYELTNGSEAFHRSIRYFDDVEDFYGYKTRGLSVRCVKDL